jgi:RNA recognition motif-containing protein
MPSIFVAKLDFAVSDEELTSLFEEYGTVSKAHIAKDRETGKPRGFAFVEMSNDEETDAAVKGLDGHTINGREIVVKIAEDRSSGKPAPRSSGDRPARSDSKPSFTPPAAKSDSPFANDGDDSSSSDSPKPTKRGKGGGKKKPGGGGGGSDRPDARENKMSAYKKSGKNTRVEFDDDDDWELEFKKSQKDGWDDEEEEEEF